MPVCHVTPIYYSGRKGGVSVYLPYSLRVLKLCSSDALRYSTITNIIININICSAILSQYYNFLGEFLNYLQVLVVRKKKKGTTLVVEIFKKRNKK